MVAEAHSYAQDVGISARNQLRLHAAGFDVSAAVEAGCSRAGGEAIERQKSMMYLTTLRQKRQGVSRTSGLASSATFNGE
jgi:hypothetical protein